MKPGAMLIVLTLLLAMPAWAGGEGSVGNGGHAVVCRDQGGKVQSVELLDFYEARIARGVTIDLGAIDLPYEAKTRAFLSRIARHDPARASVLEAAAAEFFNNALFLPNVELEFIPDAVNVIVQKGCKIEQLVVQAEPNGMTVLKRFTINKDLWDLMDSTQRAGVVFHEVIYRELLALGAKNSIRARYFNSTISSSGAAEMTKSQYEALVNAAGLPLNTYRPDGSPREIKYVLPQRKTTAQGQVIYVRSETFEDDGTLSWQLALKTRLKTSVGELELKAGLDVILHSNGAVKAIPRSWEQVSVGFKYGPYSYHVGRLSDLVFQPDGQLDAAATLASAPDSVYQTINQINDGTQRIVDGVCPSGFMPLRWENLVSVPLPRNEPPSCSTLEFKKGNHAFEVCIGLERIEARDLCVASEGWLTVHARPKGWLRNKVKMKLTQGANRYWLTEGVNDSGASGSYVLWYVPLPLPETPKPAPGRRGD